MLLPKEFCKIRWFYMLSMDQENKDNGFYAGGKLERFFLRTRIQSNCQLELSVEQINTIAILNNLHIGFEQ